MSSMNWLDQAISYVAPRAGLRRVRARAAAEIMFRHYEGATQGRRTQGWNRNPGDANAVAGPALAMLRERGRDLVRNNGYARRALTRIGDQVVGTGIVAKPNPMNKRVADLWRQWAGTTACDADGRNDFAGLQKLILRSVIESGEVLVRRRLRLPDDGLPIPLQLQVLEADYIDISRTGVLLPDGGRIIDGIEFDVLGKRRGYWLFPEHPGAARFFAPGGSYFVPAESVLHVYEQMRPGQVRGVSWLASILLSFKDLDEYEDATLVKQKIAACLAVITSDVDGTGPALGDDQGLVDSLEPGMIINVPPGRSVNVVNPPTNRDHSDYTKTVLRKVAAGIGVTYEDLTGDYENMPFSAGRLSLLSHWPTVEDRRWRTLIPQFCNPAWAWAMQAAVIMGAIGNVPIAEWTAPPPPVIDPDSEIKANILNVRGGMKSHSEVIREQGMDPDDVFAEIAADNKQLDDLGIILDSDPRNTTQQGGPRYMNPPELTDAQVETQKVTAAKVQKSIDDPPPPPVAPLAAPPANGKPAAVPVPAK